LGRDRVAVVGRASGAALTARPLPAAFDYDLRLWRTSAPATIILAIRTPMAV
jgi:hypothetical protein